MRVVIGFTWFDASATWFAAAWVRRPRPSISAAHTGWRTIVDDPGRARTETWT